MDIPLLLPPPRKKNHFLMIGVTICVLIFIVGAVVIQFSRSPDNFPRNTIVTIPIGGTVTEAGTILQDSGVIRSEIAFRMYTALIHNGAGVKAGQYLFDQPQSVLRVAYRIAYGIQDLNKIKITIPEGSDSKNITKILSKSIPQFASSTFYLLAKSEEGYLFPDTYYFYQNTTPEQAIQEMQLNFNNQLTEISSSTQIFEKKHTVTMDDIVTMASIVEKEATSTVDRAIIAGILWKRIANNYPLQVDPPFYYILGKDSSQLTLADLAIDSPYNLYKHKGLPPTPIDNPGLDALFATVNPTTTKYWYYLSDSKGNMHYAVTYDDHLANKALFVH